MVDCSSLLMSWPEKSGPWVQIPTPPILNNTNLYMRVKLLKGRQREFINNVAKRADLSWDEISKLSSICKRTLFDWRREKYHMTYEVLLKLQKISRIPVPKNIKILPEYWGTKKAARLGAMRRYELYGNPGTPKGRRQGGMASRKKFFSDPTLAEKMKFKLRKKMEYPSKSSLLAEFAGILLGDGGIRGDHQVTISFNTKTDKEYANYIQEVIGKLFGFSLSIYSKRRTNGADIVISSKNLVEFLANKNILKKGNKIVNQIDIPKWIRENRNYKISCLRGLINTDGGIYYHRYKVDGKWYKYPRLSFRSSSKPLANSVTNILKELNFSPKRNKDKVTLYCLPEIKRYFEEIGTHNPKHLERYKKGT